MRMRLRSCPAIRSHGDPLVLDPIPLSPAAKARHPALEGVGGYPQPTADDIKRLFQDSLGPRIAELVNERRNQWATFHKLRG